MDEEIELLDIYHYPDTAVFIRVTEEEKRQKYALDHRWEKEHCCVVISMLEKRLIEYTQPNMEYRLRPNDVQDIIDELKILYKYRDKVYCFRECSYISLPQGSIYL